MRRRLVANGAIRVITLAFLCGCFLRVAFAKRTNALPVEAALGAKSFGELSALRFSPDGEWLAYVVKNNGGTASQTISAPMHSGIPRWVKGDDIYVSDTRTGKCRNLTGGKGDNWLPSWSPNGRYLSFLSSRDGDGGAKIWIWDAVMNRLEKASDLKVSTNQLEWTPDSRRIVVTVAPDDLLFKNPHDGSQPRGTDPSETSDKVQGSTVILYQSNPAAPNRATLGQSNPWDLSANLRDLVSVDVTTGETKWIVKDQRIAAYELSNDGARIAYTIPERFERPGSQQILYDLAVVTLGSLPAQIIVPNIRLDYDGAEFSWSPSDQLLAYHAGGPDENVRNCYAVAANGGTPRNITRFTSQESEIRFKSSVPLWDDQGRVYFVRDGALWSASVKPVPASEIASVPNRRIVQLLHLPSRNSLWRTNGGQSTVVVTHDDLGKEDGFYEINLTNGDSRKLLEREECYTCDNLASPFAVAQDGRRFAYIAENAQRSPDLWLSDDFFRHPRPITHLNPQFDGFEMGAARLIHWLSDDGERLDGALLLPAGFQRGTRYPLIVWVYGGSSLSDQLDRFGLGYGGALNFQLFATRGYAVLLPDSPQNDREPMQELAKTVLPGANKVIEMGIADPHRLGVMGQSNGGYGTLALIVQTKRFKAAVEMDGMGSLLGLYGEMDRSGAAFGTSLEHDFDAMGGTPWEFRDRYLENSPVYYLDRIETPLLIIHGGADTAVAPFLGDQIFVGLRRLGREVLYAKYAGEGHSQLYWSPANQVDCWDRIIRWFDKYLE